MSVPHAEALSKALPFVETVSPSRKLEEAAGPGSEAFSGCGLSTIHAPKCQKGAAAHRRFHLLLT